MYDFIAFDIESTGTDVEKDEVIEIGAVRFVKGEPKDSFESLIKPTKSIPPEATRVHGITNAMVADQPALADVISKFSEYCGDFMLVAHNASFDVKFIGAAGQKVEKKLPPGLVLDTYSMAKGAIPGIFNYRLEGLINYFNLPAGKFHRAKQDALYCGQVFVRILQHMSQDGKLPPLQNFINLSGGELRFPYVEPSKQLGLLAGF